MVSLPTVTDDEGDGYATSEYVRGVVSSLPPSMLCPTGSPSRLTYDDEDDDDDDDDDDELSQTVINC